MKKQLKTFLFALFLCFTLAPAVKAEAAVITPATPSGLNLYSQEGSKVGLYWSSDANLPYYSDVYPGYYGYEVTITTLKGANIAVLDSSNDYGFYENSPNAGNCAVIYSNSKFKSQGFKFKVRSFVYDANQQKVYSAYSSEKTIIPRPTIKSKKIINHKVKITWGKVKGAKSYTIYLSSNDGKSFKKIGTAKKTNYTISKKLQRYKDYWVYVQANGVKYKGKKLNSTKPLDKGSNSSGFYIRTVYR